MPYKSIMQKITLILGVITIQSAVIFLNASDQIKGEKTVTVEESLNILKNYWEKQNRGLAARCQGATDEEIETLKTLSDFELPTSFIDVYKLCNEDDSDIKTAEESFMWFGIASVQFSIQRVKEMNQDMSDVDDFYKDQLFFYDWDGTYYAALNIDKNSKSFGKVVCIYLETGFSVPWADSYEEWLEQMVNEVLKSGEVDSGFIEEVLKKGGFHLIP